MQIKEKKQPDFWIFLGLQAAGCSMFTPYPSETIFKLEKPRLYP